MAPDRSHLSIGEVLSLLQDEFPDVTISKIRFLESQGLIDPERTPSGYRKFYESDIEILRWILRQQRENFLPLKVIKDRLDDNGGKVPPDDSPEPATDAASAAGMVAARVPEGATADALPFAPGPPNQGGSAAPTAAPERTPPAGDAPEAVATDGGQPVWMQDHARQQAARVEPVNAPPASSSPSTAGPDVSSAHLNAEELLGVTGLSPAELASLEQFGLVKSRQVGPEFLYDGEAVVVARKAVAFLRHGIEARHLRMFKVSAEREAGFLEQVVTPLLKQRNPAARRQAVELLDELILLGEAMHGGLLRQALHGYLRPQ